jgi:phosphoribosylformylglycinamidine cyclo-ligase
LLAPHRWYGPALEPELGGRRVHGLAHVTGGGIAGNLVRVLPDGCRARVVPPEPRPPVFRWLCDAGGVPDDEARDIFNLGVGMICVCARETADALASDLASRGEVVRAMGEVVAGERGVEWSS